MRMTDVFRESYDLNELKLGRTNVGTRSANKAQEPVTPGTLSDFGTVGANRAARQQKSDIAGAYQRSIRPVPGPKTAAAPATAGTAAPKPQPSATDRNRNIFTNPYAKGVSSTPSTTPVDDYSIPRDLTVPDDKVLSQPLPAKAPRDPNAPSLAQRVGGAIGKVGKGIGAVASVPQGVGRAMRKGYQAGLSAIGGPGAGQVPIARTSSLTTPSVGADEVADLIGQINKMNQRLTRAGIPEGKKS